MDGTLGKDLRDLGLEPLMELQQDRKGFLLAQFLTGLRIKVLGFLLGLIELGDHSQGIGATQGIGGLGREEIPAGVGPATDLGDG